MRKITKLFPVLALMGAVTLASSTRPVEAAPTNSGFGKPVATRPVVQWLAEANREGNKAGVAGAIGGAVAGAVGVPGALAGAVIGGAAGYLGGIAAYALFGGSVQPVRGYSAVPAAALNQ